MIYLEARVVQVAPIIRDILLHLLFRHAGGIKHLDDGLYRVVKVFLVKSSQFLLQRVGAPRADAVQVWKG